ncbi:hypothetical protein GEMRC1_000105 [Eukaryota sp. GEM-RC1]
MNILALALDRNLSRSTNDICQVIYWFRQIFSLLLGFAFGLIPLTGATGIIGFFSLNIFAVFFYCNHYLLIDEEEHGGRFKLLQEGLLTGFALLFFLGLLLTLLCFIALLWCS